MAIIPVPAGMTFSKVNSFTLQRASNVLRSKFTGQGQRIVYPFAVWLLEATLNESDGLLAGRIRSFLVQLEGQKNSFRLPVPGWTKPATRYFSDGYVFISGSTTNPVFVPPSTVGAVAARSSSITVKDINGASQANGSFLNEGDYFTINDELKMVTAPVAFNAQSQATIQFKPAIRKAIPNSVYIVVAFPTVLMTAEDDDVASWGIGPPVRQSGKFNAIEAVDI